MTVREIFLDKDCNCAETLLLWADEKYGLGVAPEDVKLVSGFGGGLGCGENCGALLGALAALSKALVRDRGHATPGFKETCAGLVDRLIEGKVSPARRALPLCGGTGCGDFGRIHARAGGNPMNHEP